MIYSIIKFGDLPWWGVVLMLVVPTVLGYFIRKSQESDQYFQDKDNKLFKLKSDLKKSESTLSKLKASNSQLKQEIEYLKTIKQLEKKNREEKINTKVSDLLNESKNTSIDKVTTPKVKTHKPSNQYPHLQDNLDVIEGINKDLGKILNYHGITTWYRLSLSTKSELRQILQIAELDPDNYNITSWREQARLADINEWDRLIRYQKSLKYNSNQKVVSKAEQIIAS